MSEKRLTEDWQPYGPWKIKSKATAYQDAFIQVRIDQVERPDQKHGQHVVVEMKPGVCILPVDQVDGVVYVYLTDEFHYGIGRNSIEAVSGGIEPEEDPLTTAQRELQEELGIIATQWEFLFATDPFTTIVVSPSRLYLASGLSFVETNCEGTEQIELVRLTLDEAVGRVRKGEITHSPTCILILEASCRRDFATQNGDQRQTLPLDSIPGAG